jgi:drug/metabolite transporter (DMT)-like permease
MPRGISALLVVVMAAWGLNIPAVKALTGVMDLIWAGALRLCVATAVLVVCLLWRDRRLPRVDRVHWPLLGLVGFLTVYLNQVLFMAGVSRTTATNTSLVMALMPLMSVLAGAWVFADRVATRTWLGLACGFAGVALAVAGTAGATLNAPGLGELLLGMGLVAFIGGSVLVQRLLRSLDVLVVGLFSYGTGAAMLLLHALASGAGARTAAAFDLAWVWWTLAFAGIVGSALSNAGWYFAIGRVGQARAGPYLYWLPVFGVVFSAWVLGESLTAWHLAGLCLVLVGTWMVKPARAAA